MTRSTNLDRSAPPMAEGGAHGNRAPLKAARAARLIATLITVSVAPAFANAGARITGVQVVRRGSHFFISLRMALPESPRAVFAALQDYRAMPRFNPDVRQVRVEPTARADQVRLFTTVHACVLMFCRTLHQTQLITASTDAHGGTLRSRFLPGGSFRSGHAHWTVRRCARSPTRTCLDVHIELEPAFWVPPVIGPWIVRTKLEQDARRSGLGLAQLAADFAKAPRVPRSSSPRRAARSYRGSRPRPGAIRRTAIAGNYCISIYATLH
ncbi:MAG: SRPBCC family protein [Steroidobacteraceae bacterium]